MNTEIDIKNLMKLNIGQIKQLEKSVVKIQDVIDQQKETVASVIEQQEIDEAWADDFLEKMGIEDIK